MLEVKNGNKLHKKHSFYKGQLQHQEKNSHDLEQIVAQILDATPTTGK
jgi:hypothetical protein